MDTLYIKFLNEKLENRGRSLDGRPIWRVVWSSDQKEKRIGKFSDFYGHIFLRERTECRTVPKYWNNPNRFVLERLTFLPHSSSLHREIISQTSELDIYSPVINGSYEPIYFFQDKDGHPLPVTEWAIEAILHALEFGYKPKSDSEMRDEYHQEIERDAAYFEAEIQERGRSPLFAFDNSVFINSKKVYTEKVEPDVL